MQLSEGEERVEEERKKKQEMEEEKKEVVRLKKRQDGLKYYKVCVFAISKLFGRCPCNMQLEKSDIITPVVHEQRR